MCLNISETSIIMIKYENLLPQTNYWKFHIFQCFLFWEIFQCFIGLSWKMNWIQITSTSQSKQFINSAGYKPNGSLFYFAKKLEGTMAIIQTTTAHQNFGHAKKSIGHMYRPRRLLLKVAASIYPEEQLMVHRQAWYSIPWWSYGHCDR